MLKRIRCFFLGHDWTNCGEYGEPYQHCRRGCGVSYISYFWR